MPTLPGSAAAALAVTARVAAPSAASATAQDRPTHDSARLHTAHNQAQRHQQGIWLHITCLFRGWCVAAAAAAVDGTVGSGGAATPSAVATGRSTNGVAGFVAGGETAATPSAVAAGRSANAVAGVAAGVMATTDASDPTSVPSLQVDNCNPLATPLTQHTTAHSTQPTQRKGGAHSCPQDRPCKRTRLKSTPHQRGRDS